MAGKVRGTEGTSVQFKDKRLEVEPQLDHELTV